MEVPAFTNSNHVRNFRASTGSEVNDWVSTAYTPSHGIIGIGNLTGFTTTAQTSVMSVRVELHILVKGSV
jgi:hypothetical protein